jgi:Rod binding domain-containing protein
MMQEIQGSKSDPTISLQSSSSKLAAAKAFETHFVGYMLKEVYKPTTSGLVSGGQAESMYHWFLMNEYAEQISQNTSLGLVEKIVQDISDPERQYGQ